MPDEDTNRFTGTRNLNAGRQEMRDSTEDSTLVVHASRANLEKINFQFFVQNVNINFWKTVLLKCRRRNKIFLAGLTAECQ